MCGKGIGNHLYVSRLTIVRAHFLIMCPSTGGVCTCQIMHLGVQACASSWILALLSELAEEQQCMQFKEEVRESAAH